MCLSGIYRPNKTFINSAVRINQINVCQEHFVGVWELFVGTMFLLGKCLGLGLGYQGLGLGQGDKGLKNITD